MVGIHEAMAYCENFSLGVLTFLAGVLAIYVDMPLVAVILCGFLLMAQTVYKLMTEGKGWELLLACAVIMALGISGVHFFAALMMTLMQLASVYDCWCHRRLHLSKDGVFANGARMEAEASRDIGLGGCVPSNGFATLGSSGH